MTKEYLKEFMEELRHVQGLCSFVADWLYEVQKRTKKEEWEYSGFLTDEEMMYDDRLKVLDSLNVIEVEAESKEEALENVTNHSFVNEIVERTHISCDELDWDYNWLDTCEDRVEDVVEEARNDSTGFDR